MSILNILDPVIQDIFEYCVIAAAVTAAIVILCFIVYALAPGKVPGKKLKLSHAIWRACRFLNGIWFFLFASSGLTYLANMLLASPEISFLPEPYTFSSEDALQGVILVSFLALCLATMATGIFRSLYKKHLSSPNKNEREVSSTP